MVVALYLCQLGAPKAAMKSMVTTIHGMKHYIRSSYGDSTKSQGQSQWGMPIARIGQGNGAGLQLWVAVSSPLFQILSEEGLLATVRCAISLHKCNLTGFGFVDDVDLCITSPTNQVEDVAQRMQCSL